MTLAEKEKTINRFESPQLSVKYKKFKQAEAISSDDKAELRQALLSEVKQTENGVLVLLHHARAAKQLAEGKITPIER